MLSMVPPAWERSPEAAPELRSFLEEQARVQEPWDGPAALIFTDGCTVGAKLDRNGLRPLRYTLTADGLLVVGSEVGIADLHDKEIAERQRLGPGEVLLLNAASGEFVRPRNSLQLRQGIRAVSSEAAVLVDPTDQPYFEITPEPKQAMAALGWSEDQFRLLFQPLVEQGQEAVWSMGDDAPPAAMSGFRRPLWDYCKQRFAQVTNPPIDSLRESHVMSLKVFLGKAAVNSPLLDAGQLRLLQKELGATERILITFPAEDGVEAAKATLAHMQETIKAASAHPPGMILLTDRGVEHAAGSVAGPAGVGRGLEGDGRGRPAGRSAGDRERAGDRYPSRCPAGGGGRQRGFPLPGTGTGGASQTGWRDCVSRRGGKRAAQGDGANGDLNHRQLPQ